MSLIGDIKKDAILLVGFLNRWLRVVPLSQEDAIIIVFSKRAVILTNTAIELRSRRHKTFSAQMLLVKCPKTTPSPIPKVLIMVGTVDVSLLMGTSIMLVVTSLSVVKTVNL